MFRLGQKVYIIGDKFEQNLPIGEYGYIIAFDRNPDNAFDYVVRVPKFNKNYFVVASDIELEEVLMQKEVERIEREALIDFALATKNQELFEKIVKGDNKEPNAGKNGETLSQQEFIKQVNLRAWI